MKKVLTGFSALIAVSALILSCGGGSETNNPSENGNDEDSVYYTIRFEKKMMNAPKLFSVKKGAEDESEDDGSGDSDDTGDTEKIDDNTYLVNNPVTAGVLLEAITDKTDERKYFPSQGAMFQAMKVDKESQNKTVLSGCTWSCEDKANGECYNKDDISADFRFNKRGKTNVIAVTPEGITIKIPAHVYLAAYVNMNTTHGDFLKGYVFNDGIVTSDTSVADMYIDSVEDKLVFPRGFYADSRSFVEAVDASAEEAEYKGTSITYSEMEKIMTSNTCIILRTRSGGYAKLMFNLVSSGSGTGGFAAGFMYQPSIAGSDKFDY